MRPGLFLSAPFSPRTRACGGTLFRFHPLWTAARQSRYSGAHQAHGGLSPSSSIVSLKGPSGPALTSKATLLHACVTGPSRSCSAFRVRTTPLVQSRPRRDAIKKSNGPLRHVSAYLWAASGVRRTDRWGPVCHSVAPPWRVAARSGPRFAMMRTNCSHHRRTRLQDCPGIYRTATFRRHRPG